MVPVAPMAAKATPVLSVKDVAWSIVNSDIILIYDDNIWAPVYIHDYRLYSNRFTGRMDDGTRRDILFDFTAVDFQT